MSDAPQISKNQSNAPMLGQRPWVEMETELIKQCLIGFLDHDRYYLTQQLDKYDLRPRFMFPNANKMYQQRIEQARLILHDMDGFTKEYSRRSGLMDSDYALIKEVKTEVSQLRRRHPDLKVR